MLCCEQIEPVYGGAKEGSLGGSEAFVQGMDSGMSGVVECS